MLHRTREPRGARALYGQSPSSILLPLVTRAAKGLQIGEVVRAAVGDGLDVVYLQLHRMIDRWTGAADDAAVVIALQNHPSNFKGDSLGLHSVGRPAEKL